MRDGPYGYAEQLKRHNETLNPDQLRKDATEMEWNCHNGHTFREADIGLLYARLAGAYRLIAALMEHVADD